MFLRRFDAQHGVVRHRGAEEPARPAPEPRGCRARCAPHRRRVVISGWGDLVVERGLGVGEWWCGGDVKEEGGCVGSIGI